jgi:PAS domain S-box-containing protein
MSRRLKRVSDIRGEAQGLLGEPNRVLRQIIETSPLAIIALDRDRKVTFWNGAAEAMFGWSAAEVIGRFIPLIPSQQYTEFDAMFAEELRGDVRTARELRRLHRDGSLIEVSLWTSLLRGPGGEIVGTVRMYADITDRKRAEVELKRRESLLNEAQQVGNLGCWEWDIARDRVYWSDQLYAIYGISRGCFAGTMREHLEFIQPEDRERVRATVRQALTSGEPFEFEKRIVRRDGTVRHLQSRGKVVLDADASAVRMLGICLDVTDQKRMQEALRESEARLSAFSDHSPAVTFMKDTAGRYLDINRQFERVFGLTREKVIGRTDDVIFDSGQAAGFRANDLKVLEAGAATAFEELSRYVDGLHTNIVTRFPLRDTQGNIYAVGGIATDITERKRAETALWESRKRLQALFDNIRDGILLVDGEARHVDANPAFCELLGYSREEMLHMSIWDDVPFHLRGDVCKLWRKFLASGRLEGEFTCLRKDGTTVEVEYRAVAHFMPDLHLCTVRDITARKRAEEELQKHAADLRSLSRRLVEVQESERRVLARELHDKTGQNLTVLNLHLGVIRQQLAPRVDAAIRARVEDSMALVDLTAEAVRDVLANLRPPVLEDYGLLAGLRWYGELFSQRAGLVIEVSGAEPSPRLPPGAETALFRVAQEALTNVAKHARATRVDVALECTQLGARITIADDGRGFDPAGERRAGAGWGLLTMQERVEAVGGSLYLDSAPGRGTRIMAQVPLSD